MRPACAVIIILSLDLRRNTVQTGLEIHQHIIHIEEDDMVESIVSFLLHICHSIISKYKVKDFS